MPEVLELRSKLSRVEASRDELARQQGSHKADIAKVHMRMRTCNLKP